MIFPLTSNWIRPDPLDPGNRIDREIADRSYRLAIGLSLENDLKTIRGVLTVSQGHGKYLRLRHVVPKCADVPEIVSQSIRKMVDSSKPGVHDLVAASSDLARCQAELVEELKAHAGKYVDRLLIVSSVDPGLWVCDEGGRRVFRGLGDPEVLSELCGITVIDSFPGRDLAAGGTGRGLGTLPAWILLADRATTVAGRDGMVFSIADWAQSCFLPASDGLDAELPEVRWASGPGINLLRAMMQSAGRPITADQIARLSVDGQTNSQLLEAMKTDLQYRDDFELDSESGYSKRIASLPDRLGVLARYRLADVLRTAIVYIVDNISDRIAEHAIRLGNTVQIYVDSPETIVGAMVNQFQRRWPNLEVSRLGRQGIADGFFSTIVSAILGLMFVDQMPANIPWITGAESQKILGRITPGTPANWRQLLREMADFHPPAMRLRDAV